MKLPSFKIDFSKKAVLLVAGVFVVLSAAGVIWAIKSDRSIDNGIQDSQSNQTAAVQEPEKKIETQERQEEAAAGRQNTAEQKLQPAPASPAETLSIAGIEVDLRYRCQSYSLSATIFFAKSDRPGHNTADVPGGTIRYTWEFGAAEGVSNLPTDIYTTMAPEGLSLVKLPQTTLDGFNSNFTARLKILEPIAQTSEWVMASDICNNSRIYVPSPQP